MNLDTSTIGEIAKATGEFAMNLAEQFVKVVSIMANQDKDAQHLSEIKIIQARVENGQENLLRECFYLSLFSFDSFFCNHRILAPYRDELLGLAKEHCDLSASTGARPYVFNMDSSNACEYEERVTQYSAELKRSDPTNLGGTYWVFKRGFQIAFGSGLYVLVLSVPLAMRKVNLTHLDQFIAYLNDIHGVH